MILCPHCAYENNNGPPVRAKCISCHEPLAVGVPRRSALDIRAKSTRYCYDQIAQMRINRKRVDEERARDKAKTVNQAPR